jgi:hypothetical protein
MPAEALFFSGFFSSRRDPSAVRARYHTFGGIIGAVSDELLGVRFSVGSESFI